MRRRMKIIFFEANLLNVYIFYDIFDVLSRRRKIKEANKMQYPTFLRVIKRSDSRIILLSIQRASNEFWQGSRNIYENTDAIEFYTYAPIPGQKRCKFLAYFSEINNVLFSQFTRE